MLIIEKCRQFLVFPSWLKIAYTWEDIPAMIENPISHNNAWKWNYTIEDLEGYGYCFDGQVELLNGPCGGGIMVPHLPEGKRWGLDGPLTYDKGADIRGLLYLWLYNREFQSKLNVSHLEHRAHAGSMFRYDKPPRNPMLYCSPEHTDLFTDEVYWLVTGRSPGKSDLLYELPHWTKEFGIELKIMSKVDPKLEEFAKSWVPNKLKMIWLKLTSENQGLGFHFSVLEYFAFHLGATEKRKMSSMHLVANIAEKLQFFSVNEEGQFSRERLEWATMSAQKYREIRKKRAEEKKSQKK